MLYLTQKAILDKLHKAGKQVTKEGLLAIDKKVDSYLDRLIAEARGKGRITEVLVNLIKL